MFSPVNAELGGLSLTWRRLLMTEKSLTDTIEDKVAMIAPTVKAIEFGGDQPFFVNCRRCSDNTWQTLSSCLSKFPAWMPQQPICTRRLPLL